MPSPPATPSSEREPTGVRTRVFRSSVARVRALSIVSSSTMAYAVPVVGSIARPVRQSIVSDAQIVPAGVGRDPVGPVPVAVDGTFEVAGLPGEPTIALAFDPGTGTAAEQAIGRDGEEGLALRLGPAGTLRGHVRNAPERTPRLQLELLDAQGRVLLRPAADARGGYAVGPLPPGLCTLRLAPHLRASVAADRDLPDAVFGIHVVLRAGEVTTQDLVLP